MHGNEKGPHWPGDHSAVDPDERSALQQFRLLVGSMSPTRLRYGASQSSIRALTVRFSSSRLLILASEWLSTQQTSAGCASRYQPTLAEHGHLYYCLRCGDQVKEKLQVYVTSYQFLSRSSDHRCCCSDGAGCGKWQ